MVGLTGLDHLVLTVRDIEVSVRFYVDVLAMKAQRFTVADGSTRTALKFGDQKLNLHQSGAEFEPKAARATAGSADVCFLTGDSLADWQAHFVEQGVDVIEGPVTRTGAKGAITSLYVRDPDGNLVEVSVYG
jgi:catechol 2,3-dioxygenase-like lactoylglutathione lyase family enzyme